MMRSAEEIWGATAIAPIGESALRDAIYSAIRSAQREALEAAAKVARSWAPELETYAPSVYATAYGIAQEIEDSLP